MNKHFCSLTEDATRLGANDNTRSTVRNHPHELIKRKLQQLTIKSDWRSSFSIFLFSKHWQFVYLCFFFYCLRIDVSVWTPRPPIVSVVFLRVWTTGNSLTSAPAKWEHPAFIRIASQRCGEIGYHNHSTIRPRRVGGGYCSHWFFFSVAELLLSYSVSLRTKTLNIYM